MRIKLTMAGAALLCAIMAKSGTAAGASAAWMNETDYKDAFFCTPNGAPEVCGPMVYGFLGGGDTDYLHATDPRFMGGGQYAKVGITIQLHYTAGTLGAPDFKFMITQCASAPTYLPPDVASIGDLPAIVRFGPDGQSGGGDDLASWATLVKFPRALAALEWARYLNTPLSFQLHGGISHGGDQNSLYQLDWNTEILGKDQCMWDAADICDPDDDPATFQGAGAEFATFSFATPTLADPVVAFDELGITLDYQTLARRNLTDALTQLQTIASDPRYAGRLCAIAIDPEIHLPSHRNDSSADLPLPGGTGATGNRTFFEDYHPAAIIQFQNYLKARYGDNTPNSDSNGDGVTFSGDYSSDYTSSGWTDFNHYSYGGQTHNIDHPHSSSDLNAWTTLDPPRNIPDDFDTPATRTKYWHAWCNFQVELVEAYVESLVQTAVDAGVPTTRMFTHQCQATSSNWPNRMNPGNNHWLDDWIHFDVSRGYSGVDQYLISGVSEIAYGFPLYENLKRRDDDWGAPEYNPWDNGGTPATDQQIEDVLNSAWNDRAKVLWMHAWAKDSKPVYDDETTKWTVAAGNANFTNWTDLNMSATGALNMEIDAGHSQSDAYLQSPAALNLNADLHPFLTVEMQVHADADDPSHAGLTLPILMDFLVGSTWYTATGTARSWSSGTDTFVLDMKKLNVRWTGTVNQLRFHPVEHAGDDVKLVELAACKRNGFTSAMQALIADKKDTARLGLPAAVNISLPYNLSDNIASLYTTQTGKVTGNLVVFGVDPDPVTNPGIHNNDGEAYNYVNNFYDQNAALSGGVAKNAIVVPQSTYLGLRKTGRFRQIQLPTPSGGSLWLKFYVGLKDGCTVGDGVEYRVILRDHTDNSLHVLYDGEYRLKVWSAPQYVDLSPYAGKLVSISLETRAIADNPGEIALWGDPIILSIPPVTFNSVAADDGRILESTETSNVGGTFYNGSGVSGLRVGDDAGDKQYKSIVSFNTGPTLPDTCTVLRATLKLKCGEILGANPWTWTTTPAPLCLVDIKHAFFGTVLTLEIGDFQAAATVNGVATMSNPGAVGSWSTGALSPAGLAQVNKAAGHTQLRVYMNPDDNDNSTADVCGFYAGE